MIATRQSVADCITFFVAFHVLSAIDNIYCEGIADFDLIEAVEHSLVFKKNAKTINFWQRSLLNKFIRLFVIVF